MPIYEFYCGGCARILSFFSRRVDTRTTPACPRCGGALSREVSVFAAPRNGGGGEDDADGMPFDEAKMADAMERFGGKLDGIGDDMDDPAKSAELVRQFSEASGMNFNKDMRDALRRLESGEDPDVVAADMEGIADSGADPFAADGGGGGGKRRAAPERDPTLYEM